MSTRAQSHENVLPSSPRGGSLTLQNGQFYDSQGHAIGRRVHSEQSTDLALAQADQRERVKRLRGNMRELAKVAVTNWHSTNSYITNNLTDYNELYQWLGQEISTLTNQGNDVIQLQTKKSRKDAADASLLRSHYIGFRTELIIQALYIQPLLQQAQTVPSSIYLPASEAADNLAADSTGLRQAYDATILQFDTSSPEDAHTAYDFSRVQVKTGKNRTKRYAAHIALIEFINHLPQRSPHDTRASLDYIAGDIAANAADPSKGDVVYLGKIRQNIDATVARHIKNQVAEAKKISQ